MAALQLGVRNWSRHICPFVDVRTSLRLHRETPDLLVLVLPIFELRPWASEDDPLAGDAPRADLAGVEVLDDVRRDQRGEHEDADGRVRVVADLVRALLAARERDDVALAQLLLALVRAQRRLAAEDDRPFLVRVVGVK